jgi:uncharacterized protein
VTRHYWVQTYTGRAFDLSRPSSKDVRIVDIAHALATLNRYTGHAAWPYSIAQHSIMVAEIVVCTRPELGLAALLHDAAEAYTNDLSSPLKALMRLDPSPDVARAWSSFDEIAGRVDRAITKRFLAAPGSPGVLPADHRAIKHADLVALATEKRDLFGPAPQAGWGDATGFEMPEPLDRACERWPWEKAKARFLEAFETYGGVA